MATGRRLATIAALLVVLASGCEGEPAPETARATEADQTADSPSLVSPSPSAVPGVCTAGRHVRDIKREIDSAAGEKKHFDRREVAGRVKRLLQELRLAYDELERVAPSELVTSVQGAREIDVFVAKKQARARSWEEFLQAFDPAEGGLSFSDLEPVFVLDPYFEEHCGFRLFN